MPCSQLKAARDKTLNAHKTTAGRAAHLIVAAGGDKDAVPHVSERPKRSLPPLVRWVVDAVIAEPLLDDVHVPTSCSQPCTLLQL